MHKRLTIPVLIFVLTILISFQSHGQSATSLTQDRISAAIYVYHRINEDQYSHMSLKAAQFSAQIDEITLNNYDVISLTELVLAFENKETLPPKTIALTFDGGYRSFLNYALPLLQRHKLPFTLFIPTDAIDSNNPQYISWADVKRIAKLDYATIGLMPAKYTRLYDEDENEIRRQINKAIDRFRSELGQEPAFFAYPFGEYTKSYQKIVEQYKFKASFGQQSSVAYAGLDLQELPRFAMTENFGNVSRFRLTASALPLPLQIITPSHTGIDEPLSSVKIKVDEQMEPRDLRQISCFVSGYGRLDMNIDYDTYSLAAIIRPPVEKDRARLNCTLPLPAKYDTDRKQWRWFGTLFTSIYENRSVESLNNVE